MNNLKTITEIVDVTLKNVEDFIFLPEDERDWLESGEQLEVTVENIGTLKNTLV